MSDPNAFYSSGKLTTREECGIFCGWIKKSIKEKWVDCCTGLFVIGIIIGWITGLIVFYNKEEAPNEIAHHTDINIIPSYWQGFLIWMWPCVLLLGSTLLTLVLWVIYQILLEILKWLQSIFCAPVEDFRKYRSAEHFRRTGQPTSQV